MNKINQILKNESNKTMLRIKITEGKIRTMEKELARENFSLQYDRELLEELEKKLKES